MGLMSDIKNAQGGPGVEPVWDQKPAAWDGASPAGTSGGLRGISGVDWLFYGAVAAISLGIGVVNALSKAQDIAWRGGVYDVRTPLFWEMSSIVTIILVAPVLFVAVRRMRHVSGWPLRIALAVATIVIFSGLHIAGMVGLRKVVMFLAGGAYDFHLSAATVIYEFRKDVITCLLIGGTLWLIDGRSEAQQARSVATTALADPASTAPHMVWLRDGSSRIRIEPRDILSISSAGNYVEYCLADGRTHLVRGTLAAEEARLVKFNIVRVHRTRLVNLTRVRGLKTGANGDFELTLDTGRTISGSRRYRGAVASIEELAANPASVPTNNGAHS
jgi:DNA-binding LytR/AlgR family response regulator